MKRLNALINQLLPFLAQEHQQQVHQAVERAKQITVNELNAIIGVSCASWRVLVLVLLAGLYKLNRNCKRVRVAVVVNN